ncbi:MAG: hypothetical protein H6500_04505 [Candidatus Woesearchaeota archaeon]|nr:MAG: hypothetical protein H6500_04505 [Candidatus Woesearchaeota archaeon]
MKHTRERGTVFLLALLCLLFLLPTLFAADNGPEVHIPEIQELAAKLSSQKNKHDKES